MMTRKEHLDWCKERALEYVDINDLGSAYTSMVSDISKHEDTRNHEAINLGMMLMMSGGLSTSDKMRDFINGFN